MNRRTLLKALGGAGAAAIVGVPLLDGLRGAGSTGALLESRLRLPKPFQRPLPIPPVLTPVRADASGDREIPLLIADRSFDSDGSLLYPSLDPTLLRTPGVTDPYRGGVLGDVLTVNGAAWPVATVPRVRHRLRLLNGSNARRYRLSLDPPGAGFVVIGTDGGLLPAPVRRDTIDLAPAQRCDVVVDFSRYRDGQQVVLRNEFGDGGTAHVMRFRLAGTADDPSRVPDRLSAAPVFAAPAVTRTLHFGLGAHNSWTINGRLFDPSRADATPRLGTTEHWRLTSDFDHPVHLHLGHFEVVSRGLSGPGASDLGRRDTIDLRASEQATIRVAFADYPGRYVFHCHNLEHEDMAMMGTMLVT
jgi:spore coat protein A